MPAEGPPAGSRVVAEERLEDGAAGSALPVHLHPAWAADHPWLVQGVAGGEGAGGRVVDMGLFGRAPSGEALARWRALRAALAMPRTAHSLQVHGAALLLHGPGPPGLLVSEGYDGHLTREPGLLLTVSVADCVPISIVDVADRRIALLHGGWRGVAAGILEQGVGRLVQEGSRTRDLRVHFGPAICGACYEVGPEVHAALGREPPPGPEPVDLRAELARRAEALGVPGPSITVSAHCTRCGDSPFFSHRGGDHGRQIGLLGMRPEGR